MAFALNVIWLKLEIKNMENSHWDLKAQVYMSRVLDEKRYISFGWSIPSSCRPLNGYPAGFQRDRKKEILS